MRETIPEAGYEFQSYDANTRELIVYDPQFDVTEVWAELDGPNGSFNLTWNGKFFEFVSSIANERDDR